MIAPKPLTFPAPAEQARGDPADVTTLTQLGATITVTAPSKALPSAPPFPQTLAFRHGWAILELPGLLRSRGKT